MWRLQVSCPTPDLVSPLLPKVFLTDNLTCKPMPVYLSASVFASIFLLLLNRSSHTVMQQYLEGCTLEISQTAIQALDIVLREKALQT